MRCESESTRKISASVTVPLSQEAASVVPQRIAKCSLINTIKLKGQGNIPTGLFTNWALWAEMV